MKTCSKCKQELALDSFFADKKSKDGRQSQCKKCKSAGVAAYYKTPTGREKQRKINNARDRKEYRRKWYHENKVSMNMSRRIRQSLNSHKEGMAWEVIVGYNLQELKEHLENKFQDGMTWDNYGTVWHIDHIKPVCSFDIVDLQCDDFKECWKLSNLQPLFAEENMSKGGKTIDFDK